MTHLQVIGYYIMPSSLRAKGQYIILYYQQNHTTEDNKYIKNLNSQQWHSPSCLGMCQGVRGER